MSTTLAAQLRLLFQNFAAHVAKSAPNSVVPIIQCWYFTILASAGNPTPHFYEQLATVGTALNRLEAQVQTSPTLDGEARKVALNIIIGLRSLIDPSVLQRPAHEYKQFVNSDRLGTLGLLASSLRTDYPDPEPPKEEIEGLIADADTLVGRLGKCDLPPDLRNTLLRHASFLAWALRNVDVLGAEGVYDAIAQAMFAATRITGSGSEGESAAQESGAVKAMMFAVCRRAVQAFGLVNKTDQAFQLSERLGHDVHQITSLLF